MAQGGRDDRDLVLMLQKVSSAIRSGASGRLRNLHYSDSSLTVEIIWSGTGGSESFKKSVESAGLKAEVLSLTPRANEVEGRIRLTAAAVAPKGGS